MDVNTVICLNYRSTDTTSPTAVRNSFSKTVTLAGTPTNNEIFGRFWRLDKHIIDGDYVNADFDSRKRVDFTLQDDKGEILEKGYVQLGSIRKEDGKVSYELTLYGQLGDFFYSLAYDGKGEERTLADLYFGWKETEGEENDSLLFRMDKDFVTEGWDKLSGEAPLDGTVSDTVVAAPTYSGLFEDFDSDKCLIYTRRLPQASKDLLPEISGYGERADTGLVTLPRECSEWEMRDIRAQYQRPAIRFSCIMDAIVREAARNGYTLRLSDSITSSDWYKKAYVILNRLSFEESDINDTGRLFLSTPLVISGETSLSGSTMLEDEGGSQTFTLTGYTKPSVTLNIGMDAAVSPTSLSAGMYTNTMCKPNVYTMQGWIFRLDAVKDGAVVAHSNSVCWQTETGFYGGGGTHLDGWQKKLSAYFGIPMTELRTIQVKGSAQGSGVFSFPAERFPLTIEELPAVSGLSLRLTYRYFGIDGDTGAVRDTNLKVYACSSTASLKTQQVVDAYSLNFTLSEACGIAEGYPATSTVLCNVDKKILLGGTKSPFRYLIDYCKLFDYRFRTMSDRKEVLIEPRSEYYINETVGIENSICRRRSSSVTPTLTESKYYQFLLPTEETYASHLYAKKENGEYGGYTFNTGYYFNNEKKNLFEDSIYRNAVPYRLSSMYFNIVRTGDGDNYPQCLISPTFEYTLWNGDMEGETVTAYGSGRFSAPPPVGDATPKLCLFDEDNKDVENLDCVICFFDGMRTYTAPYQISDNLKIMEELNEKPCWYYTEDGHGRSMISKEESVVAVKRDSLPVFSKYLSADSGEYTASWDFAKPQRTFIQDSAEYGDGICLYERFWQNYVQDVYDRNTTKVTLYAFLPMKPQEAMRRFFWFDNCIWTLTEVSDWCPDSAEPVKCTFIKINDRKNYIG